jgi:large subunit ribosomal protein L25
MHPDSVVVVMIKTSRTAVAEDEEGEVEAAEVPSSQNDEATE